jgi:hypothetical protein
VTFSAISFVLTGRPVAGKVNFWLAIWAKCLALSMILAV